MEEEKMNSENNILLKVSNITKSYTKQKFLKKSVKNVLNDVSFSLKKGKCLGIIGESGSGKSTLGRILTGIENADNGIVEFEGKNIHVKKNKYLKREISIVFQNYVSSVNPKFSIAEIIAEPLTIESRLKKDEIQEELKKLIESVGLSEEFLQRFPNELSGGQLQRVCIARAIATRPKFIMLDEAVSSLDVSTQVEILDLLQELKKEYNLSYIFVTHDLLTITYICDSVIFFKDGKIEEEISDIERLSPGLLHTKLGAFYAKNVYGVEDVDVLSAITYHTTGRPDMGLLEEIIYVADYIEPSRPALPYIDEMRACAFSDLHRATLFELKSVITKINKDNGVMDKRTEETYEFYKKLVEG